ncbi:MAG TPA: HEAT repeat domain-containing protein, partial [Waterburya sp.]
QLRSRNFILCYLGADSYGFVHRTFLEYFCACEFVERFGKRGLEGGLTLEELKTEVFGKHLQDESWHEVLRLISGMIDTSFAGEIIEYLMALDGKAQKFINLFLAAKCLSDVRNRNAIATASALLLDRLKTLTNRYDLFVEEAISTIATIWQDDPNTLPWLKNLVQSDVNEFSRAKALEELVKGWKNDSEILPILKQLALSDGDNTGEVNRIAIKLLVKGWKNDPNTLLWLKELAQSNSDRFIRHQAMQQLVKAWKDEPDILPWLKNRAQSDVDPCIRQLAVNELADAFKDSPDMPNFLANCAINECLDAIKHKYFWPMNPRQAALAAITKQYPEHPQTLPLLRNRVENDPDDKVREFAMQELAKIGKDEPGMFEFFCHRALNDPFERQDEEEDNLRQLALEIIIKQYPDHPQTIPLLRDRAENDPDDRLRQFANKKLAELEV